MASNQVSDLEGDLSYRMTCLRLIHLHPGVWLEATDLPEGRPKPVEEMCSSYDTRGLDIYIRLVRLLTSTSNPNPNTSNKQGQAMTRRKGMKSLLLSLYG
jgi:hypothetical protein